MSKWKERIPGIVISVLLVAVFAVFMVILLQSKMVPTCPLPLNLMLQTVNWRNQGVKTLIRASQ